MRRFQLADGRIYQFHCEKIWKGVFLCQGASDSYRLYRHKGLKYSIFQGEGQIAAFTKNALTIGKGNRYEVRMNEDADLVIVVCIVLAVNTTQNSNDDATVTYNLGNIGPEERPFDARWEPD